MDQGGTDPFAYLINFGVAGAVLVLWLMGFIVSRREQDRERERTAEWKAQYEAEASAHLLTLRALERERERMDASTEASRMTAAMLNYLGHRPLTPSGGDGS